MERFNGICSTPADRTVTTEDMKALQFLLREIVVVDDDPENKQQEFTKQPAPQGLT